MKRHKTLSALALLVVFACALVAACAGANGDPAPAPQEAGADVLVPCVDAGAAG